MLNKYKVSTTLRWRTKDIAPPWVIEKQLPITLIDGIRRIGRCGFGRGAVIEEAGETALASARGNREESIRESADLIYHLLVLLSASEISPKDIWSELRARQK